MNREVNLTKRVQTPHGWRYCTVVLSANGRVKPDLVIFNGKQETLDGAFGLVVSVMAWSIKGDVNNIFLPPPAARVWFATSSPSHHRRRSCGVVPLGYSISAAASSLVATTPISFETESSRAVVGCQPWVYLRLGA